jgi:hypothetical protein
MADRPIPFKGPMVRAIIEGRKTQTRRVLDPQPDSHARVNHIEHVEGTRSFDLHSGARLANGKFQGSDRMQMVAAPYAPGDRLWVREAWRAPIAVDHLPPRDIWATTPVCYEADGSKQPRHSIEWGRYRHSMFMTRWASRLTLIAESVRIERLQEISEEDAVTEGAGRKAGGYTWPGAHHNAPPVTARTAFSMLWESINGAGSWDANPWVAAITFRSILANIDQIDANGRPEVQP